MYTSTPPAAPHLPLIAQQKADGCRYFGCGDLAQRYSAAISLLPRLLRRQVRNTARQTDREMPVNAASTPNSRLEGCSVAGRDFSETPSFTLMGLVVGGLRLRATTEEALHKKKKYNLHLFIIKEELGKLRMPPLGSLLMPRQRWMDN